MATRFIWLSHVFGSESERRETAGFAMPLGQKLGTPSRQRREKVFQIYSACAIVLNGKRNPATGRTPVNVELLQSSENQGQITGQPARWRATRQMDDQIAWNFGRRSEHSEFAVAFTVASRSLEQSIRQGQRDVRRCGCGDAETGCDTDVGARNTIQ
ncbi:hypothetical protein C8R44DRAFT_742182 [Mycena epipterygia]|nr:hypothetical protein C8R44DRAFT_742182 [Mycena epipterygia]